MGCGSYSYAAYTTLADEIPENFPLSKYGVSYYDKLESFD